MDNWHARFLGLRHLPREVTAFEVEVFFQFSDEEARIIEERQRCGADDASAAVATLGRTILHTHDRAVR